MAFWRRQNCGSSTVGDGGQVATSFMPDVDGMQILKKIISTFFISFIDDSKL